MKPTMLVHYNTRHKYYITFSSGDWNITRNVWDAYNFTDREEMEYVRDILTIYDLFIEPYFDIKGQLNQLMEI